MGDGVLRIIQISDTHLFGDQDQSLLKVQTQKSLEAVLHLIQQNTKKIDLILHSGDISQDYSEASYLRMADMLAPFNVPVYCVPGNHDDPKIMSNIYPHGPMRIDKRIISDKWQIILLDSHKDSSVAGHLSSKELNYLESCLREYPNHYSIPLLHHQPIPVGCEWLDNLGLTNANDFWNIVLKFSNVNNVLFGHVHQQYEQVMHNIHCYSTPSTCFQFMRKQNHFGLENLPQGYRWINLYDDGHLETAVIRVSEYIGHFDKDATGY